MSIHASLQEIINVGVYMYQHGKRDFVAQKYFYYKDFPREIMLVSFHDAWSLNLKSLTHKQLIVLYDKLTCGKGVFSKGFASKLHLLYGFDVGNLLGGSTFSQYILRVVDEHLQLNAPIHSNLKALALDQLFLIDSKLHDKVVQLIHNWTKSLKNWATEFQIDAPVSAHPCSICFEREAVIALNPCGHANFCLDCISHHIKISNKCPICRETIQSFLRIFH